MSTLQKYLLSTLLAKKIYFMLKMIKRAENLQVEFFLVQMVDLEGINPFGLPDELFATFPFTTENGEQRFLKMGVGIFAGKEEEEEYFEELPWTWYEEDAGLEKVVVFRQEAENPGGYSYLYEKRYRFRADAAFFALDVVWENRGETLL